MKFILRITASVALLSTVFSVSVAAADFLKAAQTVKHQVLERAKQTYQVQLQADDFMHMELVGKNLIFQAWILNPDGEKVIHFERVTDKLMMDVTADRPGAYSIQVEALPVSSAKTSYTFTIKEIL